MYDGLTMNGFRGNREFLTTKSGVRDLVLRPDSITDERPIVLIPGQGLSPEDMNPDFVRGLATERTLHILDIRNPVARTIKNLGTVAVMDQYVTAMERALNVISDHEEWEAKPDAVGYSWGGGVVDAASELFNKTVAISSPRPGSPPTPEAIIAMNIQAIHEFWGTQPSDYHASRMLGVDLGQFKGIKHETSFGSNADRITTPQQAQSMMFYYATRELTSYGATVRSSSLAINGGRDPVAPPSRRAYKSSIADLVNEGVPTGVTEVNLTGEGHPLPSIYPNALAKIINNHLSDQSPSEDRADKLAA